jgi:hypothetical protein
MEIIIIRNAITASLIVAGDVKIKYEHRKPLMLKK